MAPGRAALLLLLVPVLGAAGPSPARAASPCAHADAIPTLETLAPARRATLCLINVERAARGVPIVHTRAPLRAAARRHATNMMHQDFFAHTTPGGQTLEQRVTESGYLTGARAYRLGEILGWGRGRGGTPRRVVRAWMESPPHRRVLLDGRLLDAGIGAAFGAPRLVTPGTLAATYAVEFAVRDGEAPALDADDS